MLVDKPHVAQCMISCSPKQAWSVMAPEIRKFSIVIPAHNEERYIARTLEHVNRASKYLQGQCADSVEVIVVDNASADHTGRIAEALGATVVKEQTRNVARARNTGAKASQGEILIFIDADTIVPEALVWRIYETVSDPTCIGGAVDADYRPARFLIRAYLRLWRLLGKVTGMAQGATQFCRRNVFESLGGYSETLYMGEDVDFYWRLGKAARNRELRVCFIGDLRVLPSCRRFDQWPFWRTLVWTNPLFILLFRRRKWAWDNWYRRPLR